MCRVIWAPCRALVPAGEIDERRQGFGISHHATVVGKLADEHLCRMCALVKRAGALLELRFWRACYIGHGREHVEVEGNRRQIEGTYIMEV